MTRNLLLATAAVLLSSASASADRVYLKDTAAPARSARTASEEETLPFIEGVVTSETKDSVTIRVEGGLVTIGMSRVAKIEKGGLTVEDLQRRESEPASRPAPVDHARLTAHAQWVE